MRRPHRAREGAQAGTADQPSWPTGFGHCGVPFRDLAKPAATSSIHFTKCLCRRAWRIRMVGVTRVLKTETFYAILVFFSERGHG